MSTSPRAVALVLVAAIVAIVVAVVASDQRSGVLGGPETANAAPDDPALELTGAVEHAAREMVGPAHGARSAAADLRSATADAIAGTDDAEVTGERIELRAERLRRAADELSGASAPTIPVEPGVLPVADVDQVLDAMATTGQQAAEVAQDAHDAAGHTEQVALAALDLTSAAASFAASTGQLPDSDDPDAVAAAWRDDLERIEPYRQAVDRAGDHAELAELASAHAAVVDAFEHDARTAVELIDDGDVDGYNDHREAQAEGTAAIVDELLPAAEASLDAAVQRIERAEAAALALLTELEGLRTGVTERFGAA